MIRNNAFDVTMLFDENVKCVHQISLCGKVLYYNDGHYGLIEFRLGNTRIDELAKVFLKMDKLVKEKNC